jgi:hypothetical protein
LPRPTDGHRAASGFLHNAVSLEIARRELLAKKTDRAKFCDHQWKIVHHTNCSFAITEGRACIRRECDCDPVFLIRFDGQQVFAVAQDGRLEPFEAPPLSTVKFQSEEMAFRAFTDAAWDVAEWLLPILNGTLVFTSASDGVTVESNPVACAPGWSFVARRLVDEDKGPPDYRKAVLDAIRSRITPERMAVVFAELPAAAQRRVAVKCLVEPAVRRTVKITRRRK